MVVLILAVTLFCALAVAVILFTLRVYHIFCRVRLAALSIASKADAVGGVGVSVLCTMPRGVDTVVGLLGSLYPMSEVVVVMDRVRQSNLFQQLRLRYSLVGAVADSPSVYRSQRGCYRRLVVVLTEGMSREAMLDAAARNAIYDYLLSAPEEGTLCRSTVGHIADTIAAQSGALDVVTTSDRGVVIVSRAKWRKCGGFGALGRGERGDGVVHMAEPMVCYSTTERGQTVVIERAEYNFWGFLSLFIMKYRNKLLSLKKP